MIVREKRVTVTLIIVGERDYSNFEIHHQIWASSECGIEEVKSSKSKNYMGMPPSPTVDPRDIKSLSAYI